MARVRSSLTLAALLTAGASIFFPGCGPELDRISKLNSLRILGVKKSAPYARPGESVELEMFWEDVGRGAPRPVTRFMGFWCTNPLGDLFGECISRPPDVEPQFVFDSDRLTVTLPEGILKPSGDPALPRYGVAFVFYGVCAGRLSLNGRVIDLGAGGAGGSGGVGVEIEPSDVSALPTCLDEEGKALGADDFVVGYSAIYAYEDFRNQNPIVTGFRVAGKDVRVDCIDGECLGLPSSALELEGCEDGVACIDACEEDGSVECPEVDIQPLVDRASVEQDEIALASYGSELEESLWVSYFVDRGTLRGDVRLVNDATTGWNEKYGTALYAPREPGPLRIWAVVRDNRGGSAWVRVPAYVK